MPEKDLHAFKVADLDDQDINAIKELEKQLKDTCLIAVEKKEALYVLEAKLAPNQWERVDKVYSEIKDLKAYYPDEESAKISKGALKNLLQSKKMKEKKKPIRVRKVS